MTLEEPSVRHMGRQKERVDLFTGGVIGTCVIVMLLALALELWSYAALLTGMVAMLVVMERTHARLLRKLARRRK